MARRDVVAASENQEAGTEPQFTDDLPPIESVPDYEGFAADLREDDIEYQEGLLEMNTDFNLNDEYKQTPLAKAGKYLANVIGAEYKKDKHCISIKICLDGNEGFMSDGETPLDGQHFIYNIWLPKPGDETEYETNGRVTKRQGKINRMKKTADKLKVDMSTPRIIATALANSEWVGLQVFATLSVSEWNGEFKNDVNDLAAR